MRSGARLLGAHVPTAGGLQNGPLNGHAIGATAIQVFTRNQRQWQARPILGDEVRAFRTARAASGVRVVLAHASYLINLASPEAAIRRKGQQALLAEIDRCALLGIELVVFHPGAHMQAGIAAGVARVAESLDRVFDRVRAGAPRVLAEITAGQGSSVGHSFEQLAEIIARCRHGERLGVCLDTCHLFAAGYDLTTPEGYRALWRVFDRSVGRSRLAAVHLNDAKRELGSRVDRHAPIGKGRLGRETFRRLMNDRRLARIPLVMETPGPAAVWRRELAWLRRLVSARR